MNITDILHELGIPIAPTGHHHRTQNFEQSDCPFCSPDSGSYRLGWSLRGGFTVCWSCGSHSAASTLREFTGLPWGKVLEILGGLERVSLPREERPRGKLVLPSGLGALLPPHRKYLKSRGFDPDQLEKLWKIQGIELNSRLNWRVWIPIHFRGKAVSWTTRSISDKRSGQRYLNARPSEESIPAKSLLYGADLAKHAVIIVEGPSDVWRIGPGAVALMGLKYSTAQVRKLKNYPVRVICLDNEPEARKVAEKLLEALKEFPGVTWKVHFSSKDAASAPEKDIQELRQKFLDC